MDPETTQRLMWVLAALGFATAILGAVGELRGWWNDVGQILMGAGTLVGVVMSSSSLLVSSSSEQVEAVLDGQETTHETLESMDSKLDKLDELDVIEAELNAQTGALDRQLEVLEQIRDAA